MNKNTAASKVEIFESTAMSSVDYAWIWKVFLASPTAGSYTLSCQHVYSPAGELRKLKPITKIKDGYGLYKALNKVWFEMTNDSLGQFDVRPLVDAVNRFFPELGSQLQTELDKQQSIY